MRFIYLIVGLTTDFVFYVFQNIITLSLFHVTLKTYIDKPDVYKNSRVTVQNKTLLADNQ